MLKDCRVYRGEDKILAVNVDLWDGEKIYIDGAWYEVLPPQGYGTMARLLMDGIPCPAFHAMLEYRNGCWECTCYLQGCGDANLSWYE